jgi:formate dehydrogenase subunit delta
MSSPQGGASEAPHFEHDANAQLVKMANAIGNFFHGETDHEIAIAGIANHIRSFWTKRMRQKLLAYIDGGGTELTDLTRVGFLRLERPTTVHALATTPAHPAPGGDAG